MNLDSVDSEEKIFAEIACLGFFNELRIGCAEQANVNSPSLRRAHALKFTGLKHPQQLGLLAQRNIGNLIEEKRAAVGQLKTADAVRTGVGEGALYVPEDFAFEGSLRQAAGIHGDERLASAGRGSVQQASDNFFAGAVFAGDEHVSVGRPDLSYEFEHWLHRGSLGDEFRHAFCPEEAVFKLELASTSQRLTQLGMHANEGKEAVVLPRLLHEVTRAALDALHSQSDVAPRSHDDDGQSRIVFLNAREQVEAFAAGSGIASVIQVDEQYIVVALAKRLHEKLR